MAIDLIKPLIRLERASLSLPYHGGPRASENPETRVGGRIVQKGNRRHVVALDRITFNLMPGDCVALLGYNGAGKTSLLRLLAGIFEPSGGVCHINAKVTALLTSTLGLDATQTGRQNIYHACTLLGAARGDIPRIVEDVIEFSELGDFINLPINAYSAGMRTRLGFSIVTAINPDVLVIDEVLSTGDLTFALKAQQRILDYIARARGLVVASHSADLMRLFCNRALWLEK